MLGRLHHISYYITATLYQTTEIRRGHYKTDINYRFHLFLTMNGSVLPVTMVLPNEGKKGPRF